MHKVTKCLHHAMNNSEYYDVFWLNSKDTCIVEK